MTRASEHHTTSWSDDELESGHDDVPWRDLPVQMMARETGFPGSQNEKPALVARACIIFGKSRVSVAHGDAGNLGALQGLANRFGLIMLQSGEPRAVELAIAFRDHRLGEGVRLAEQAAGLI